jgi:hypothetical protein
MSEPKDVGGDRSPVEAVLDVVFYAPIGLALNAEEMVRQMATRGRQSVTAARFIGQMAVAQGRKEVDGALSRLQDRAATLVDQLTEVAGQRTSSSPQTSGDGPADGHRPGTTPPSGSITADPGTPAAATPVAVELAIPDYDSLAASQVVPRLAGLSADELDAVDHYERAHRGRKTILNRVAQLQRI